MAANNNKVPPGSDKMNNNDLKLKSKLEETKHKGCEMTDEVHYEFKKIDINIICL